MFLALWYSLRGYVKIKIVGFSAERFMNMASFRGVSFWDISYEGTAVTMKAAGDRLDILQSCAEKTGCSLQVLWEGGLPVFWRRLKKRQVWTAGLLCFAVGLYLLSSFLWTVQVEGNERLSEEEVLSACAEMGVKPGAWKRSLDPEAVTKSLLLQFSDLSWVSVHIDGTDATIRLAETIEKPELVDKITPCDIVASQDGIILQVTAERGTTLVQAGDVVQKGDVLISSELVIGLEGEEQHTEYTAAEGTVMARIWQRLAEEMPLQYTEVQYSGIEQENHSILFSEKEVDIIHPDGGEEWEKELLWEKPLKLGDFRFPLHLRKEIWKACETVVKTRTLEETKSILEENLRKKTENLLSPYGTIEEIEFYFEEYADSVRCEAEAVLLDRIEKKQEINIKERENLNEF